jgi:uncharacterized protein Yka (UPF0111/DUF47 family)
MKHWFLPHTPDLLGLLRTQAATTVDGLDLFAAWSAGDLSLADAIDDAEHAADDIRRDLQAALRAAFSTPLDPQDIYELSERLDNVLNGARDAVREAELMRLHPNAALAGMAADLANGVRHLRDALAALPRDAERATAAANTAIRCQRNVEHAYRPAMSALIDLDDLRVVIAWREMYRRYARIGEDLVRVAERVWYAAVKS